MSVRPFHLDILLKGLRLNFMGGRGGALFLLLHFSRTAPPGVFRFISNFWNYILFGRFGRTTWMGDRPIARSVRTQDSTTQKNADIMPRVGFEHTTPVF